MSHAKIGDILLGQGKRAAALDEFRTALRSFESMVAADPNNVRKLWSLLNAQWRLANVGDDAARRFAFIVATLRKLRDENRMIADMPRMLAAAETELAKLTQR